MNFIRNDLNYRTAGLPAKLKKRIKKNTFCAATAVRNDPA
jgi:hypothetical protein